MFFRREILLLLVVVVVFINFPPTSSDKILSRKKRYLVFPEGSSLSLAICMTAQTGITPGELFTEGINWGISYELPNDTKEFQHFKNKPKALIQRRNRRDLYGKMEKIMRSMGYNGEDCIMRALCEASHRFQPKGESLLNEILRIVFRYPKHHASEMGDISYESASREPFQCSERFSGCPFSLIDLALGYYSVLGYEIGL